MLSAREFVLQLRHLLFCIVQHTTEFIGEPQIGGGAVNCWAALQLRAQAFPATDLHLLQSSQGVAALCPRFGPERAERKCSFVISG